MKRLGSVRVRCRPYKVSKAEALYHYNSGLIRGIKYAEMDGRSILSEEVYLQWMELCKQHGLVPKIAKCYRREGCNIMEVMRPRVYDKHMTYAALCCYRWSECKAPMIYEIVAMSQRYPTINFWQVLHYVLARHEITGGHSFVNMRTSSARWVTGKSSYVAATDLARSVATCGFFERQKPCQRKSYLGGTVQKIDDLVYQLRGMTVPKIDVLLEDRWGELYRLPRLTKEPLHKKYAEIAK
jgi:hypothetical protein